MFFTKIYFKFKCTASSARKNIFCQRQSWLKKWKASDSFRPQRSGHFWRETARDKTARDLNTVAKITNQHSVHRNALDPISGQSKSIYFYPTSIRLAGCRNRNDNERWLAQSNHVTAFVASQAKNDQSKNYRFFLVWDLRSWSCCTHWISTFFSNLVKFDFRLDQQWYHSTHVNMLISKMYK